MCSLRKCSNTCRDAAICLCRKNDALCGIGMDGLVEVKGIQPFVLLAWFIEKWVFIMSCCIHNFSRYFPSHSGIPLTIFTVISLNISSCDLDLVVSGGRGFCFVLTFYQQYFQYFQLPGLLHYFFLGLTFFQVLGRDIFPSLGFCIVSILGCFKFVSVTWDIKNCFR